MQSVSSRILTRVTMSISYDDNHYTISTSNILFFYITVFFLISLHYLMDCLFDSLHCGKDSLFVNIFFMTIFLFSYHLAFSLYVYNCICIKAKIWANGQCHNSQWKKSNSSNCYVLTVWPGHKCHLRWCTGRKWHIPMASNRKRSRGRIKAYNMGQGEGPTVPIQTDAPEESDLWTAWQLFLLDDD